MGKYTGIRGDPWHNCDRCDFSYRFSQLIRQLGLFVCNRCVDSYVQMQRLRAQQRTLSDGKVEVGSVLDGQVFDEGAERGEF